MENKQAQPTTGLALIKNNQDTIAAIIQASVPGVESKDEAIRMAIREISNVEAVLMSNPSLSDCKPESFFHAVKQCLSDGLTLSESAGLAYLIPSRIVTGIVNNQEVKEWIVKYSQTANGKLSVAYQSGTILDHEMPEIFYDANGKVERVIFKILVPSFPNPRWQVFEYKIDFFERLRAKSAAKSSKGIANKNYTSHNGGIDPGFAATKAILHSLKRRGTNPFYKRPAVILLDEKKLSADVINKEIAEAKEAVLIESTEAATEFVVTTVEKVSVPAEQVQQGQQNNNSINQDLPI